jgi:GTPase
MSLVAIVGRPNVGKSTLFNRLVETRQAIVFDEPGVTRDRNTGSCTWNGRTFTVVDTGGYVPDSADVFEAAIREQVEIALAEADVIIFVVDVVDGLIPSDASLLDVIRRSGKDAKRKVVLAANKVDNAKRELLAAEFYSLGLDEAIPMSAMTGSGTGDLLDRVVSLLPADDNVLSEPDVPRLAVVGRPNVGKSSLINALLDRPANIVTPIAGTTRDSIATRYKAFGFDFFLIDTAGLRRRARVKENIEFYSVMRTIRAIEECTIALIMIDATSGIEAQDLAILHLAERNRKGVVILVNKWDLADKTDKRADVNLKERIEERIAPLSGVPILFVSATEKLRLHKTLQVAKEVHLELQKRVPTRKLNDVIVPILQATPPPSVRGKLVRIKFMTQVDGKCPTFVCFGSNPELVRESYKRFVESRIREHFGFKGCPIQLYFRAKD